MNCKATRSCAFFAFVLLVGLLLLEGCAQKGTVAQKEAKNKSVFSYDPAEFPGAKPWTSEEFKNNPDEFQFAILGDRGGGASPLGTYERAIEQLNWMQPEFVMSVGDYVEGYTTDPAEMDEQWEEFEAIVAERARGVPPAVPRAGDKEQLPALFHCTTGKDRTGWAAAALLTLLGVPKDIVMEDYLRSNDYIIPAYQNVIAAFVAAGGDAAIPPAILGVKKEYLDAAFDEVKTQYGTIEKYFSAGLSIDAAQQKALRDLYLAQK